MKAISLWLTLLVGIGAASGEPGAAVSGTAQGRLKSAIERALSQNPDLQAMEARLQAARARVPQATALPDPELEVGIKDIPPSDLSLSRSDFTMEMVTARQKLPGPGKLGTEKRVREADLSAANFDHYRHVIETAADVADSFFHLAELDRRIVIVEETRRRLSDAASAARERYSVGKGAQADVLRADLEKTALDDRLLSLRADRRSESARFDALQLLPADAEVPPIELDAGFEASIDAGRLPDRGEILDRAQQRSPAIESAAALVRRAGERLELAKLERRPDWMVAAYYARREKFEDLAGASVSLNFPWAHPRRLDERRAEGEAELAAARADLSAIGNALRRDIERTWAELSKERDQVRLYRESILPQAEINYRAAHEAYSVGAIDFLTYVRAATDLDAYEAESIERETGAERALAALQKASGLPLIAGTPQEGEHDAK